MRPLGIWLLSFHLTLVCVDSKVCHRGNVACFRRVWRRVPSVCPGSYRKWLTFLFDYFGIFPPPQPDDDVVWYQLRLNELRENQRVNFLHCHSTFTDTCFCLSFSALPPVILIYFPPRHSTLSQSTFFFQFVNKQNNPSSLHSWEVLSFHSHTADLVLWLSLMPNTPLSDWKKCKCISLYFTHEQSFPHRKRGWCQSHKHSFTVGLTVETRWYKW